MFTRSLGVLLLILTFCKAVAQPIDDPAFNPTDAGLKGICFTEQSSTTAIYRNPADGSLLVAGLFTRYNGAVANRLIRLTSTGQPDAGFSSGTGVLGGFTSETDMPFGNTVTKIIPVADGKFLLVGNFRTYQGITRGGIVRILANGSYDASFNNGGVGGDGIISDALVLPNGDIIIGGSFTTFNGTAAPRLARLSPDGALLSSFNPGNGPNSAVFTLDTLSTGALVIGGSFTTYNGSAMRRIGIINRQTGEANGTLSAISIAPSAAIARIKVLPNDDIICAGNFNSFNGVTRNHIAIINSSNGAFASSFSFGTGFNGRVNSMAVLPNGHLLIGGNFTSYSSTPAKNTAILRPDGSLDPAFNPQGYGPGNVGSTATVEYAIPAAPGKYLIGGGIKEWELISYYGLLQITENGLPDPAFNPATGVSSGTNLNFDANEPATPSVNSMARQADGKLIIGGNFSKYNGAPRRFLARLLPDGTLDESFDPGGLAGISNIVNAVAVQPDGKTVVAGGFLFFGNTRRNHLLRLNADGTLDETWNPVNQLNGRISGSVKTIIPLPGGKLLLAGSFSNFNLNNNIRNMVVLNADGTVDAGFTSPVVSGSIEAVLPMPDGKFVVGGRFLSVNNGTTNVSRSLFRLNADGSFDATFNNGNNTTSADVNALTLLADGRIAIGGSFDFTHGSTRRGLAILNSDGTISADLAVIRSGNISGLSFTAVVGIGQIADGSLVVVGRVPGSTLRTSISQVGLDGRIPAAFFSSTLRLFGRYSDPTDPFTDAEVFATLFSPEGAIVGGRFGSSGQRLRNNITRLLLSNTVTPVNFGQFSASSFGSAVQLSWSTLTEQNNKGFYVERSANGIQFTTLGFVAAQSGGNSARALQYSFDDRLPQAGTHFYRLRQIDKDGSVAYSKVVSVNWNAVALRLPNPLPTSFAVGVGSAGRYQLRMTDAAGRVVHQQTLQLQANGSVMVTRPSLAPGWYQLQLLAAGGIHPANIKVVVE